MSVHIHITKFAYYDTHMCLFIVNLAQFLSSLFSRMRKIMDEVKIAISQLQIGHFIKFPLIYSY